MRKGGCEGPSRCVSHRIDDCERGKKFLVASRHFNCDREILAVARSAGTALGWRVAQRRTGIACLRIFDAFDGL
jgi:hypothetical protein